MGEREPKLDNARNLRGIYFTEKDDREDSQILKKCIKKIGKTHGSRDAV